MLPPCWGCGMAHDRRAPRRAVRRAARPRAARGPRSRSGRSPRRGTMAAPWPTGNRELGRRPARAAALGGACSSWSTPPRTRATRRSSSPEVGNRDPFAMLAGVRRRPPTRLSLATGVVSMESRPPATIATGAATLHELSRRAPRARASGAGLRPPGRASVGYASEVRAALASHPLVAGPPPVWFAALGDRAVEAAAARRRRGPVELVHARARGRRGGDRSAAARARRAVHGRRVPAVLPDRRGRRRPPRGPCARPPAVYAQLPHYRRQFEAMGFGAEAARGLEREPVPDRLVDAVCVRGGREELAGPRGRSSPRPAPTWSWSTRCPPATPSSSMLGTILAAAPAGREVACSAEEGYTSISTARTGLKGEIR